MLRVLHATGGANGAGAGLSPTRFPCQTVRGDLKSQPGIGQLVLSSLRTPLVHTRV